MQRSITKSLAPVGVRGFSAWAGVQQGPPDAILGLVEAFNNDTHPDKVSLSVGAYRSENGTPYVLDSVVKAEEKLLADGLNKEYAGIAGVPPFVKASLEFAFGGDSKPLAESRVAGVQTLSGTGACRLAGEFFNRFGISSGNAIYQPNPTWGNHIPIFRDAGMDVKQYKYYKKDAERGFDFEGMLADINAAPDGSAFLLHACAHNPTGVDPKLEQWQQISQAMKAKNHVPFFDSAYQGFASGDPEADAAAIRSFVDDGHQVVLAQSYSKNFGLYGERVGCFGVVCKDSEEAARVDSQLKILIRPTYSNPPIHGARIVQTILENSELRDQWFGECKGMADRIISMRALLKSNLENAGSTHSWEHITDQIGMFCYTGLSPEQVDELRETYHIYITRDGRVSMAGVTPGNAGYVAESIHAVTSK